MWTNDDCRAVFIFLDEMRDILEEPKASLDYTGLRAILTADCETARKALVRIVESLTSE